MLTKINASTLSDSNPSFCEMVSRRHLTTSKTRSANEMLCMIPTACKWYDSEFKSEAGRNKASETSMGCKAWTNEGNDVMSLDKPTGSKLLKLYFDNHVMLTQLKLGKYSGGSKSRISEAIQLAKVLLFAFGIVQYLNGPFQFIVYVLEQTKYW